MQAVSRQSLVGGAGGHRLATPRSVLIGLQISRTLARGNLKERKLTLKVIWDEPFITFVKVSGRTFPLHVTAKFKA